MKNMTPKEIVAELDKYIIGQDEAKKSVAIALRNRYRRNQLSDEMREEITPKNILMMGPTGVGKTEIARRLARIMEAPFIKVEATKYTEVGYVGRDVESMIRDLVEASVRITKQKHIDEKYDIADQRAEDLILEALVPDAKKKKKSGESSNPFDFILNSGGYTSQKEEYENKQNAENAKPADDIAMAREQVRRELRDGKLENELVEIDVEVTPNTNQLDMQNEGMGIAIGNIFGDMMPKKTKHKKLPVKEARKILREQEAQSMLDMDQVVDEALMNAEQNGIVFIDEIDKIASGSSVTASGEVSREGVQRDILPIVEGSVVNTKHGPVKTDHMLFIGAGAFHVSKPSDLIPELQGRFPIKVELKNLDKEAFKQILTVPENAVIKQQKALLETEGVQVEFTDDAIDEIAGMAFLMNEETENIGARRLYTIMETLLEDVSYELPNPDITHVLVDREMVQEKFKEKIREVDVDKYIL
ncbi:MAG: ATP-dependent protease ATPase subunit HslU [Clostridia bacterium]|uniref:ATP-dependent protease ATPase subunit HslU n=1 Tax=Mogibacterium kristiansenii TaxID=2606708 RepID=A0A6N7XME1_9FIRM|nr:ATP-dependent protease ATPase subunit HslU [Clostridia bacterium]MEE0369799.1 ATP-dependent protease ATPase subunit HslU [Clostridia bacterium]MEE0417454.1 ATP-dependent protease ATPase subunit HslU [Clostridia bacterium]MEE1373744.1 ATP-dependent protease ATPase subunit HslU [Clostridia bacterium]MST71126.1 ATP-dependent protease ATPase subunit HslU [Mogibacterium kristiansenii]